jgi:transcriptional regulator with XRE-family HTH domain
MILLTTSHDIGRLLRHLRTDAQLSVRQLAARMHLSKSGVSKRENHNHGMVTTTLVHHLGVLGYELVIVPARRQPTGTGWPEETP